MKIPCFLLLLISVSECQFSSDLFSFQYALSNTGSHATVISYDDETFYMSFKHLRNSVCKLTKQSSTDGEVIGYTITDEFSDCEEFEQGWNQLAYLTNQTDGSLTTWFYGPDNEFWKMYSEQEVIGDAV
jgi:hypothetical protein